MWIPKTKELSSNKDELSTCPCLGNVPSYTSSTSSSINFSDQIVNPSHGHTTCMHHHTQPNIQLVGKNQRVDRQDYVYQELVETSSVQSQNQKYLEIGKTSNRHGPCTKKVLWTSNIQWSKLSSCICGKRCYSSYRE